MTAEHYLYQKDANGVHLFHFLDTSQQGVDEWLTSLNTIIRKEGVIRYMVFDLTAAVPPIRYFIDKLREFQRHYFATGEVKAVFIYEPGTGVLSPLRALVEAATHGRNIKIRFFPLDAEEQAQEWLLS